MNLEQLPELRNLTKEQKLKLASELWEDALGGAHDEGLRAELQRCRKELEANPDAVIPGQEVRWRLKLRSWRGKLAADFATHGNLSVDDDIELLRGR